MSKEIVQNIINKALTDAAFRIRLLTNPDEALKEYKDKLTSEELTALKSMKPEVLDGFSSLLKQETEKSPWSFLRPNSFKELMGAILSVILIGLLLIAVKNSYSLVGTEPIIYTVGNNTQSIDTYDRSKDLLVTLFPIFTAVVTFWLGVAVEGRRADENQANAETERQERVEAEQNEKDTSIKAASALSKAEGILSRASAPALAAVNKDDIINEALTILQEGQESIRRR